MRGYKPRPSQTRYGQRVDNPEPELSDTAEIRVMVREATQDIGHEQQLFNAEVGKILEVNKERWQNQFRRDAELADKRDLRYLWAALGLLATACGIVAGYLFLAVRELERRL